MKIQFYGLNAIIFIQVWQFGNFPAKNTVDTVQHSIAVVFSYYNMTTWHNYEAESWGDFQQKTIDISTLLRNCGCFSFSDTSRHKIVLSFSAFNK